MYNASLCLFFVKCYSEYNVSGRVSVVALVLSRPLKRECGHTVTLGELGWGIHNYWMGVHCIWVGWVPHTTTHGVSLFYAESTAGGCATWRGSPQVAANTSPGFTKCFPRFWSPSTRFLGFPHFYSWIWASGATLCLYLWDKGVGVRPNANGFIKTDPADDAFPVYNQTASN